jgi:hypothetical protein
MTWRVIWSPQSQADLLAVGFEVAADVGRAVIHWTETAEGLTELLGGDLIRIVAPGTGHAIVKLDETRGAFQVLRIHADNPLPFVVPLLDEPNDDEDDD